MNDITINLSPLPLKGMRNICNAFGVSRNTFIEWVEAKAPIACIETLDKTVYCAEYNTLLAWLVEKSNRVLSVAEIKRKS